jgi:hypothetical protein
MIDPRHERFLTDRLRTHQIEHSGRDFYTHLKGTYELLESWGNPLEVCHAGLYHSIYGTRHFRRQAFPIEKRAIIRTLIGARAERLAYVFCVTARPTSFLGHPSGRDVLLHDHHTNGLLAVSWYDLVSLLEIEAANLIEQGGQVRATLERLRDAPISAAARGHIDRWMTIRSGGQPTETRRGARLGAPVAVTATFGAFPFTRYGTIDGTGQALARGAGQAGLRER